MDTDSSDDYLDVPPTNTGDLFHVVNTTTKFKERTSTVGIPLLLPKIETLTPISVHESVALAMEWTSEQQKMTESRVTNLVQLPRIKDAQQRHLLTEAEAAAVLYYTLGNSFGCSIYRELNITLSQRSMNKITAWVPYLNYLLSALEKFPVYKGLVYRAIDSKGWAHVKYTPGTMVTWASFVSTSNNKGNYHYNIIVKV